MFITSEADAYDLRCTYPAGRHTVSTQFNVSDITTYKTIQNDGSGPRCQLLVTNEQEKTVSSASVGEVLRLILSVKPNGEFMSNLNSCR
jgi:hypothetical protein